jgi:hypothetical protein
LFGANCKRFCFSYRFRTFDPQFAHEMAHKHEREFCNR